MLGHNESYSKMVHHTHEGCDDAVGEEKNEAEAMKIFASKWL